MTASARPHTPTTQQRSLCAWLALCVLLVQGLLPVAQARMSVSRGDVTWSEVCTTAGTRWVRSDTPGLQNGRDEPDSPEPHPRCWACTGLAQAAVAPPPAATALLTVLGGPSACSLMARGAEACHGRAWPAPRGPPVGC